MSPVSANSFHGWRSNRENNPINLPSVCASTPLPPKPQTPQPPHSVAANGDRHMKTVASESQLAPLIKSLGRKMSLLERKERGKIIGEKRGERDEGRREGGEGIKSVFCVVSETHFLVRG